MNTLSPARSGIALSGTLIFAFVLINRISFVRDRLNFLLEVGLCNQGREAIERLAQLPSGKQDIAIGCEGFLGTSGLVAVVYV